jgi:hypothetical protein
MHQSLNGVTGTALALAATLALGGCKRAPNCPPCPSCKPLVVVSAAPSAARPPPAMPLWASLLAGKRFAYSTAYPGAGPISGSLSFSEPRLATEADAPWDWVVVDVAFATDAGDPAERWVETVSAAHGEERKCKFDRANPLTGLAKAGHKVTVALSCPNVSDLDELDFRNGVPVILRLNAGAWSLTPDPSSAPPP